MGDMPQKAASELKERIKKRPKRTTKTKEDNKDKSHSKEDKNDTRQTHVKPPHDRLRLPEVLTTLNVER